MISDRMKRRMMYDVTEIVRLCCEVIISIANSIGQLHHTELFIIATPFSCNDNSNTESKKPKSGMWGKDGKESEKDIIEGILERLATSAVKEELLEMMSRFMGKFRAYVECAATTLFALHKK